MRTAGRPAKSRTRVSHQLLLYRHPAAVVNGVQAVQLCGTQHMQYMCNTQELQRCDMPMQHALPDNDSSRVECSAGDKQARCGSQQAQV